jgi:hypothetical protein
LRFSWVLKDDAGLKSRHRGVWRDAGGYRVEDVLEHGLDDVGDRIPWCGFSATSSGLAGVVFLPQSDSLPSAQLE